MKPDIIDYEYSKTGNYMPDSISAIFALIDKFVSSFGATIVGACILLIEYVSVQPQPNDPSTTALFWMTMFLWMGLPFMGYILTLISMKFYPLERDTMIEIQKKNNKLREGG